MNSGFFVSRNKFDRLGVFTYSHEEGTHSHSFEDNVPETDVLKDEPKQVEEDEACESCTI